MGLSDLIEKAREKSRERKELMRRMDDQMRAEEILSERKKSANERELDRFFKENREESIKVQLDQARKIRDNEIKFGHNPLNAKNVVTKTDWEVLKSKNLFKETKSSILNQPFIHKNNPKLLHCPMRLMR
jgi:hypothetical protein